MNDQKRKSPFVVLSESLHDIDILFNSKRENIVKSLREGSKAWEQRKKQYSRGEALGDTPSLEGIEEITSHEHKRARKRSWKDEGYPSRLTIEDLLRVPEDDPREKEVRHWEAAFDSSDGSLDGIKKLKSLRGIQRSKAAWERSMNACQANWASLAGIIHQRIPIFGTTPQMPKARQALARFNFVTLPGSARTREDTKPDLNLSLEEILKPFAGLSQLLGAYHEFKTMEDLNRMISKAADEFEAMREDKLNDGRPLGPLQREALRRKREKANKKLRSSLRDPGRHVAIYTTASLPWMTGTAVNPLLRAAYLAKDPKRKVTLVIPWLAKSDQEVIFPNGLSFDGPDEQKKYVVDWVKQRTGMDCNFDIVFYPSRYATEKCSILPVGDPTAYIPDAEADVAVLEEPEHLNWYHHGRRWTDKFRHVVGVIHTNYLDYAMREEDGEAKAKALAIMNQLVCRMHCHKVVKLSDAVQPLPRQTTAFVHGVPHSFIKVGEEKAKPVEGKLRFANGAYFIGKAIWAKGYTELLDLMNKHTKRGEERLHIDCYGSGEDLNAMKEFAQSHQLDMTFHGGRDHLDKSMHDYRVFVNPSKSDVVATTTAEALAMGKWVLVHDLPCNKFFSTFSNCLTYTTPEEFSQKLGFAMKHEPKPMRAEERERLTWEAATERFLDVAELKGEERATKVSAAVDTLAFNLYNYLTGVEALRAVSGAGVNTLNNPLSLKDFVPTESASGGFFDDKKRLLARATKGS